MTMHDTGNGNGYISNKTLLSIAALLITLFGIGVGLGWNLFGDRLRVEGRVATIETDVSQMKHALEILASNRSDLDKLKTRVDDHDRRLERLEGGH